MKLACCLLLVPLLGAQEPAESVIRTGTQEVMLDVVVRQKNSQFARKLTENDFRISEDGVPQKIRTFRLVGGDEPEAAPPGTSTAAAASGEKPAGRKLIEPSFVSIVFDQIGPGSRDYARSAAQEFLKQQLRANTYVALFGLNYRMNLAANFTNDRAKLVQAVDRAVMNDYSHEASELSNFLNQATYAVVVGGVDVPVGRGAVMETGVNVRVAPTTDLTQNPDMAVAGASAPDQTNAALSASKIITDQRDVAMYQGGMRSLSGLMRIVQYQASLPGRKTVIYLSEGLNLPPGQSEYLQQVIAAANRAQVAFYTVDVRGLEIQSGSGLSRSLLKEAAAASQSQADPAALSKRQATQEDVLDQMMVADTRMNMTELANATGGFSIVNTNEIGKAMNRIMEDVRTHYEISYVPTSNVYDGHFRKIDVKVANSHLTVQSRKGYFALPQLDGKPVQPFEMPALAAIDSKQPAKDFPLSLAALQFRPTQQGYRYEIGFDIANSDLSPEYNAEARRVRLHAVFVGLIKDARGHVVEKVSREVDREVPQEKAEQFLKGEMIVTAPVVLLPGRYTLEGAVYDPKSGKSSVKRSALVVGAPGPVPVSDVALVRDLVRIGDERDLDNPLEFSGGHVTPEFSQVAAAEGDISFYFVVYPAPGAKPKVDVQFYHDGALVAQTEPALGEPDRGGIPILASAKLPPGNYEARVIVDQGGRISRKSTAFRVSD